jgi:hypothetical protein
MLLVGAILGMFTAIICSIGPGKISRHYSFCYPDSPLSQMLIQNSDAKILERRAFLSAEIERERQGFEQLGLQNSAITALFSPK